ncbi:MAG: hypothetical protein LBF67_04820 [Prevotellaceae bacterium]|nr:hypothetical protein [Prevotellaceae bacterium]
MAQAVGTSRWHKPLAQAVGTSRRHKLPPQTVIPSEAHEARVRAVEEPPAIITMPSAHVVRTSSARRPHVVRMSSIGRR